MTCYTSRVKPLEMYDTYIITAYHQLVQNIFLKNPYTEISDQKPQHAIKQYKADKYMNSLLRNTQYFDVNSQSDHSVLSSTNKLMMFQKFRTNTK